MPSTPEQKYLALIMAGKSASTGTLNTVFEQLKPVNPSFLTGEWVGGHFELPKVAPDVAQHADWVLSKVAWGKVFRADGNVDPLVLLDPGAKVVETEFCGVVSAAIVSDKIPFIDYLRYVNDDTVAGQSCVGNATLAKFLGIPPFHFYMKKRRSTKL
ncbi:Transcription factor Cmr1 [Mycena sanguinolenta]|uniref:Transcription factor Cmr1 n=1 Tax=Mycena sanguinolenta TaxID=230812 RepID=A0A8H6YF72_9AGAR|nr:Transcription factor Cmr1 [Mycena sanguinolenta]